MFSLRVRAPATQKTLQRKVGIPIAAAINRTLEEAQIRGQQLIHQRLTVRSGTTAQYLERLVRYERSDRATPERLHGQMGLQAAGTGTKIKSAKILIQLATGGEITRPRERPFYIPTTGTIGARPTPRASIARALYPAALRLINSRYNVGLAHAGSGARRGSRGGVVVRGKRRSFAVDPAFHAARNPVTYGIYQRRDRGPESDTVMLWVYRTRIRIPKRYPFREEALREAQRRLPVNLAGFLQNARKR